MVWLKQRFTVLLVCQIVHQYLLNQGLMLVRVLQIQPFVLPELQFSTCRNNIAITIFPKCLSSGNTNRDIIRKYIFCTRSTTRINNYCHHSPFELPYYHYLQFYLGKGRVQFFRLQWTPHFQYL